MEKTFPVHRSFVIYPAIRERFKITSDEYQVFESIRYLSTRNPEYRWCMQKKELIAAYCAVSRATVFRAIKKGKKPLKIIEVCADNTEWCRTTQLWNDLVTGFADIRKTGKSQIETDNLKMRLTQSQNEITPSQDEIQQSQIETPIRINNKKNQKEKNTPQFSISAEEERSLEIRSLEMNIDKLIYHIAKNAVSQAQMTAWKQELAEKQATLNALQGGNA